MIKQKKIFLLFVAFLLMTTILFSTNISLADRTTVITNGVNLEAYDGKTITILGNGTIVATYKTTGVYNYINISRSKDNGTTWTKKYVNITNAIQDPPTCIIADKYNKLVVFWTGYQVSGGAKKTVRLSTSTDGGNTWSPAYNFDHASLHSYYPSACYDSNNKYHIVYETASQQLRYSNSTDGGVSWNDDPMKVLIASNAQYPQISCDSLNNLYIIYYVNFPNKSIQVIKSTDSGRTWSSPVRIILVQSTNIPSSVIDSNNNIYVSYYNSTSETGGVCKSTNGGTSWTKMNTVSSVISFPKLTIELNDVIDMVYFVQPSMSNIRYINSTNGGSSWSSAKSITGTSTSDYLNPLFEQNSSMNFKGFAMTWRYNNTVWLTYYNSSDYRFNIVPIVTTNSATGVKAINATLHGTLINDGGDNGTTIWDNYTLYDANFELSSSSSKRFAEKYASFYGTINSVDFKLLKDGIPTGDFYVRIRRCSDDSILGEIATSVATLTGGAVWYTFIFSPNITVVNTDIYVCVEYGNTPGAIGAVDVGFHGGITRHSYRYTTLWEVIGGDLNIRLKYQKYNIVCFQYGLTTSYGIYTTNQLKVTGQTFSFNATGLTPGKLCHYRAVANNTYGTGYGADMTFLTKPNDPTGIIATVVVNDFNINWTHGLGYNRSVLCGKTGAYPANPQDSVLYNNTGHWYNFTPPTELTYYFRVWEYSTWGSLKQFSGSYSQGTSRITHIPTGAFNATNIVEHYVDLNATIINDGTDTGCDARIQILNATTYPNWNQAKNTTWRAGLTNGQKTYWNHTLLPGNIFINDRPGMKYHYRLQLNNSFYWNNYTAKTFISKPDSFNTAHPSADYEYFTSRIRLWFTAGGDGYRNSTVVVYKTTGFPTSTADGTIIYNSTIYRDYIINWTSNSAWNSTLYLAIYNWATWGGLSKFSNATYACVKTPAQYQCQVFITNKNLITPITARVWTTVKTNGQNGWLRLEYGLTKAYGTNTAYQTGVSNGTYYFDISGLTPGKLYYVRAKLNNSATSNYSTSPILINYLSPRRSMSSSQNWSGIYLPSYIFLYNRTISTHCINATYQPYASSINIIWFYNYSTSTWWSWVSGDACSHYIYPFNEYWLNTKSNFTQKIRNDDVGLLTRPEAATNANFSLLNMTSVNLSWTMGIGANRSIVVKNNFHNPASMTDGTIVYNGTSNYTVQSVSAGVTYYFRIWSWTTWTYPIYGYSMTLSTYSSNYTDFLLGGLFINCYDEDNGSGLHFRTVMTNQSATQTYSHTDCTNTFVVPWKDCPKGEHVAIVINSTYHELRTYYLDIERNIFYILNAYLPYTTTPSLPSNDSYLYLFTIIDEKGIPIDNVHVIIKGLVNGSSYETLSDLYSTGNGQFTISLIIGKLYKMVLEKTGYISVVYDFIPTDVLFTQTFKMYYEPTYPQPPIIEPESIHFTGILGHISSNSTYVLNLTFLDESGHTNSTLLIISSYNFTTNTSTIIATYTTNSEQGWTVQIWGIDRNMTYLCNLTYIHFYLGTQHRSFILEKQIWIPITPGEVNALFDWLGIIPFGAVNLIMWLLFVAVCYYADSRDIGKITIVLGVIYLFLGAYVGMQTKMFGSSGALAGGTIPALFIAMGILMEWNTSKRRQ